MGARVLALRLDLEAQPPALLLETARGTVRLCGTVTAKLQLSPGRGVEAWVDVDGDDPQSVWMRWALGAAPAVRLVPELVQE